MSADGVADRSLYSCREEAETSADQQFYVVAGPGFEPGNAEPMVLQASPKPVLTCKYVQHPDFSG
jgi:hypothetical protein